MSSSVFSELFTRDTFAPMIHLKEQFFVFLHILAPYSTVFSLLLITGIAYCFLRIEQLVHETKHEDVPHGDGGHKEQGHGTSASSEASPSGKRFERVMTHLNSDRESDFRLAILEADVLLDEMVTHMGYHGDSLGEKLKGVEKSDFLSLDQAWEAHAVRNKIAHEGSAFALTDREAKRVVKLYEDVFNEFHYV